MIAPYTFTPESNPVEVNVSYTFVTKNGHEYRVTFSEVTKIMDFVDEMPVISNGIYVIVDAVHENGMLGFDGRLGITIVEIIRHYLDHIDRFSILVFNCDSNDGKQVKRHYKFERWFKMYADDMAFEKIDEEILEPSGDVYVPTFISVLFAQDHPRRNLIFEEVQELKKKFTEK